MVTPEQIAWVEDFLGLDPGGCAKTSAIGQAWDGPAELVSKDFKSLDRAAHELGSGMDHAAEAGIEKATDALDSAAGNAVGRSLRDAAEGVRGAAKQEVAFDYGVAAGGAEAVGEIIKSTGDLIGDGVRFATDGQFRGQVVEGVKGLASTVVQDPLGTASRIGKNAMQAGKDWEQGAATAAQEGEGNLGEYVGRGLGSAVVNVGIALIPGASEADAANLAEKGGEAVKAFGGAEQAGQLLSDTDKAAQDVDSSPRGLAFRVDLAQHLQGPDGFKGEKLHGTHNQQTAIAELKKKGAKCTLTPTKVLGISELKYEIMNSETGRIRQYKKTVYDQAVYSNEKMIEMAQDAGKRLLLTPSLERIRLTRSRRSRFTAMRGPRNPPYPLPG